MDKRKKPGPEKGFTSSEVKPPEVTAETTDLTSVEAKSASVQENLSTVVDI